MTSRPWFWRVVKPALFLACFVPLVLLAYGAVTGQLSANPADDITDQTGRWTLRFLMITLAITPVRRITGWNSLIRFRRMIGLFAFFYGFLHLMTYVVLDRFFDFPSILVDIPQRPFITAGFTAFVCMLPLAITSTKKWIGRLGGKRWQMLHRLVYVSTIAGVLHYLWLVKLDPQFPLTYALVLSVLLGYRVWIYLRPRILASKEAKPKMQNA